MAAYIGQHIPDFESVSLVSMITEPLCAAGLSPTEADRITMALVFLIGGHLLVDMPADSSEDAASAFEDGVDLILGGARARVEGRCQRR